MSLVDEIAERTRAHVRRMVEVARQYNKSAPWSPAQPKAKFDEDRLAQLSAEIGYGDLMKSLQDHAGYKVLEQKLRERRQTLCDSVKFIKHKELTMLQAQLTELDFLLDIVPSAVETGKLAKNEREEIRNLINQEAKEFGPEGDE